MSDVVSFGSSIHRLLTSEYRLRGDSKRRHYKHHGILTSRLLVFIHEGASASPSSGQTNACHQNETVCSVSAEEFDVNSPFVRICLQRQKKDLAHVSW